MLSNNTINESNNIPGQISGLLKIGSWNINGIFDSNKMCKLSNHQIDKKLREFDILGILETHILKTEFLFQNENVENIIDSDAVEPNITGW